jgi:protein tyrosine phosphatase (PTP) superfamily phosphohydrolase (DUF442 family)
MRARALRIRRWVLRSCLALALAASAFLGWNLATGNFATVRAGRVYRSGQMRAADLGRIVRTHAIKTVLNLRGAHPEEGWYRAERSAVLSAGATQIDMALSSCEWMSRDQARTLLKVLETSEYPLLVHCWRGSERTGLVSAMTELLRPGGTFAAARGQFSLRYLFVRAGDGALMLDHLERYADWLRQQGLEHTPEHFSRWMTAGFTPGRPGREDWPYDPYPLVVVTRPASAPAPASAPTHEPEGASRDVAQSGDQLSRPLRRD